MVNKYMKEQERHFELIENRMEMVERRMDEVERRECIIEDRLSQIMMLQRELVRRLEVKA